MNNSISMINYIASFIFINEEFQVKYFNNAILIYYPNINKTIVLEKYEKENKLEYDIVYTNINGFEGIKFVFSNFNDCSYMKMINKANKVLKQRYFKSESFDFDYEIINNYNYEEELILKEIDKLIIQNNKEKNLNKKIETINKIRSLNKNTIRKK